MASNKKLPVSARDGISLITIDTDIDSNLYSMIVGFKSVGTEIIGVIPFKFHGNTDGYIVIAYDKKKDSRYEQETEI